MFILAEFKDVVKIDPWKFSFKFNDAIEDELNRKLSNKVFLNVGLCIALHDITHLDESYIFPGDGSSHTKVTFRFIVFRPYIEEILIGRIRSSSSEGVHVTLGFFDDILIPPNRLQHPSKFNQERQEWAWIYENDDGETFELSMEIGDLVRVRIISESFVETLPSGPADSNDAEAQKSAENSTISPYTLEAAVNEPGLGVLEWWSNA